MTYNFDEQLKNDAVKHGTGGGSGGENYFNFEEGNQNVIRIMQPAISYVSYFLGKGVGSATAYGADKGDPRANDASLTKRVRYATYVLDRKTAKVKLATGFPYSVMKAIAELQKNPDYAFDDLPMPYDVRVTYKKEESPANIYTVSAVPMKSPCTFAELEDLAKQMGEITPSEVIEKMKEKQMKKDKEAGIWIDPSKVFTPPAAPTSAEVPLTRAEQTAEKKPVYPTEPRPEDIAF